MGSLDDGVFFSNIALSASRANIFPLSNELEREIEREEVYPSTVFFSSSRLFIVSFTSERMCSATNS
jgi:hypothetical protein